MKVLHIGKQGNMEKYAAADSFLLTLDRVDLPRGLSVEEYLKEAADAEFLVADAIVPVPGELIRRMPSLRMIHSEGVAFNSIDLAAADECGVYVCNCQGMNAAAVAEQTLLLMLGILRDVVNGDRSVREGRQIEVKEAYISNGNLHELRDCSVGLVGFGNIARETAALLRAFGVKDIRYYKRNPLSGEEEETLGVKYLPLDDLLSQSDFVSLHVPVTPETMHLADRDFFSRMKAGSFFINTSRGELVDDEALLDALESGQVAMAGLDTLDLEPVKADHPLLGRPSVQDRLLLAPHIGGITSSSFRRGYAMISEDIRAMAEGREPMHIVNHPGRRP
ncbi:MAG: 2-hydroxyacid dehydrogenase [Blautia sp.]|nr:2-hydroxyacid dehydrogenase [Blautia sp.]